MSKRQQIAVQERKPKFTPISPEETRVSSLELFFRKASLSAITMVGLGYVLVNAPIAILIGHSISTTSIASQADVSAIASRIMFLMASGVSIVLGLLLIFGAVRFYERGNVKGIAFLGVSLSSFYLLCLGIGSILLLSETAPSALTLTIAPLIIIASAALYASSNSRSRLLGSVTGVIGGAALAYAIFNLRVLELVFEWNIPFTGPFLSFTVLESAVVILAPIAAVVHEIFDQHEERPISRVFTLLIGLVYGLGAFIGSIVLSMSFWDWIWKSPWIGPFQGSPEWVMNTIVFWSASLVLMDIGGVLLIAVACLGFICVARELSKP